MASPIVVANDPSPGYEGGLARTRGDTLQQSHEVPVARGGRGSGMSACAGAAEAGQFSAWGVEAAPDGPSLGLRM